MDELERGSAHDNDKRRPLVFIEDEVIKDTALAAAVQRYWDWIGRLESCPGRSEEI